MTFPRTTPDASAAGTVTLGGDLTVNRLGFGAMRLPGPGAQAEPSDPAGMRAVLRRAVDLGVNLIDTADYYGPGVANRLIAEALHPYPSSLAIATKVGAVRGVDGHLAPETRLEGLRQACEDNLRHLRLNQLDLVHFRYSGGVPLAESVGILADLQREGKIRHVGISNVTLDQLAEAQQIVPVASVQNRYNLTDRAGEDVLDACARQGIAFMPYFPLAIGQLAASRAALAEVAPRHDATPAQVALAWLLARSPVMLPIPGTSSLTHLEENVAAASLELGPEDVALLDRAGH